MSLCTFTIYGALSCKRQGKENHMEHDIDDVHISTFDKVSSSVQVQVCKKLFKEWRVEYTKHNVNDGHELCLRFGEDKGNELFVVFNGVTWVGVVGLDPSGHYGLPISVPCVNHMYVRKKYRSQGYGKKLMEHIDTIAHTRGYRMLALWCDPPMRSFYRRFGWTQLSGSLVSNTSTHTDTSKTWRTPDDLEKASSVQYKFSAYKSATMLLPSSSFRTIFIMAKTYFG